MKRANAEKIDGAVLVADDHEVVRFGLGQLIKRTFGAKRLLEADRFDSVMKELEKDDVRLVVCDLAMPGLDGVKELARIRQVRPDVKLVVLSGIEDRETVLGALDAGVHGYIVKTTTNDGLIERLKYILSGEIYVPPLVAERASFAQHAAAGSNEPVPAIAANGSRLSPRQMQVLGGLVRGLSNKEIARELELAEGTIKMHVGAVLRALGASNRAHAAALGQHLLG